MYIITIHGQPQTRLIAGCQAQGDELVARLVAAGRTPLTITVGDPPLRDRAEKARAAAIVEDVMS